MSHGLVPVVSARSAQRRLVSLARANEVRVERAQLKRALAAGSVAFAEVLANRINLGGFQQMMRLQADNGDLTNLLDDERFLQRLGRHERCPLANTEP